jgi:uncharacterized protein YjbI with pentapeptide repeats
LGQLPLSLAGLLLAALFSSIGLGDAHAADLTVRQLTERLYHSDRARPLDLSRINLRDLDLSGLDFKAANLAGSNLFGADLTGADLSRADLHGALLDRIVIIGTHFNDANLSGVSLLRPSAFSTLAAKRSEAASFAGANLTNARIFARFNGADFSGAKLDGATLAPFGRTGFIEHIWRTELLGANLSHASLVRANLTYTMLAFANLRGADLTGAVLHKADLSRADLTGANLTGADLSEADLDGAILTGVRGLETALGMERARNLDKIVR